MKTLLIILGAPLWLPLLIAAGALLLSLIITVWSVFISLAASSFAGVILIFIYFARGNTVAGFAIIGAFIACIGLLILMYIGCKATTKYSIQLVKKMIPSKN